MEKIISMMKNSLPRYVITQPSTGKKVTFRPFTVREEKHLLMIKQTGEYADLLATIANIIDSCFELNAEAKKLPIFDIEYFFLKLRSKSIGEIVEPTIICPHTGERIKIILNIDEIQPTVKNTNFNIKINENIIVNMKYPTLDILLKNADADLYDVTLNCIESIESIDEKIENSDISKKEFLEFIDLMTNDQFKKIIEFIKNVPSLEKEIKYKTSDNIERTIKLKGIKDFFQ
jgi:hypothetical protein